MARMYPTEVSPATESAAERRLFGLLKTQLSNDFVVLHSVPLLSRTQSRRGDESEADFVILHEKLGMLLIEVKGGTISADALSGTWTTQNKHGATSKLKRSPFDQARRCQHQLIQKLKENPTTSTLDFNYSYAVAFPDITIGNDDFGPDAPRHMLIGSEDLARLDKVVTHVMGRETKRRLGEPGVSRIVNFLKPTRHASRLGLRANMLSTEEKILTLQENQYMVMDFIDRHPRAIVQGCAGSGKTLLAFEKTKRLAQSGYKVLFVCFNKKLAAALRNNLSQESGQVKRSIDIHHFHGLASDLCRKAGIDLFGSKDSMRDSVFWNSFAPNKMLEAISLVQPNYDAVIVDEGQDFALDWWDVLEFLLADPQRGIFLIFCDEDQLIYRSELCLPDNMQIQALYRNFRNPQPIHKLAIDYFAGSERPISGGPKDGEAESCQSMATARKACWLKYCPN